MFCWLRSCLFLKLIEWRELKANQFICELTTPLIIKTRQVRKSTHTYVATFIVRELWNQGSWIYSLRSCIYLHCEHIYFIGMVSKIKIQSSCANVCGYEAGCYIISSSFFRLCQILWYYLKISSSLKLRDTSALVDICLYTSLLAPLCPENGIWTWLSHEIGWWRSAI